MRFTKVLLAVVFVLSLCSAPMQVDAQTTTVILARHGQTDYNKTHRYQGHLDIPLNEVGLQQAELLAQSLKDYPIDVFISSPLKRAYITTETVAKAQGKSIAYTDDRLKEINYGDWSGQFTSDLKAKYLKEFALWQERPWLVTHPNGESLMDMQYRGRKALEEIVAKYPGKTIFIGAHSFLNATILCSVLGLDPQHFPQITQNNTCVNVLRYEDGVWKVVLMNSIAHLGKFVDDTVVMK